jgi:hypothetical protein
MSNRTAFQTADADEPHNFFDLVIPLTFSAVALLATAVSLEAIGFIAWRPATFLAAYIFD